MLHRITLKCLYFAFGTSQNRKKNTFQFELRLLFLDSAVCDVTRYVRRRVSAAPRAVQLGNTLIFELKMSNFYTNFFNFSFNVSSTNSLVSRTPCLLFPIAQSPIHELNGDVKKLEKIYKIGQKDPSTKHS